MKLNSAQVEQTLTQFEANVIPDDHPLVPKLNELFGDHTFFPRQQRIECRRAKREYRRGRAGGDGGKPCQLERCAVDQSGAPRTRADGSRRHT